MVTATPPGRAAGPKMQYLSVQPLDSPTRVWWLEPVAKLLLPIGSLFRYTFMMAKSISVKRKKRGRPATGTDPLVGVRLPEATIKALDAWAAGKNISRSEAIREFIDRGLSGRR